MTDMNSTASEIASRIKLGWNLGNTLEAIGGETNWGNPRTTPELLQLVKQSGFDAIRLPVSWNQYANTTTAQIDAAWLNRVRQVVQDSVDAGLYVIVNIHWDGGWLESNIAPEKSQETNDKQKAFWQQIATHLRDFDEHVMFASANEPDADDASQMAVLDSYHQTFVNAVRSTGGKNAYRVLVVQGPRTDIELTNQLWRQLPADTASNRLMAELHFYTPYQFTLMQEDASWGKQFYYWGSGFHSATDTERNPTWGEESEVDRLFALVKQQFVSKGIPVVLGEFAAQRRTGQLSSAALNLHLAARAYYHKYVTQKALENGILPFYWDIGATGNFSSSIFNRASNAIFDEQTLNALLQGAGRTR